MISSKSLTQKERSNKIKELSKEHLDYLSKVKNKYVFIPKMAYRPSGKDEKFITFFPSEMENECDIYTEFVSKLYESEDPKRTLYLLKHNSFWKEEYELNTSKSGFTTHLVPVSELKVINDIRTRNEDKYIDVGLNPIQKELPPIHIDIKDLVKVMEDINYTLQTLNNIIRNK